MTKKESMLLGQILRKADINLTAYGINLEELAEGEIKISYEEMQNVLGKNPITHMLSVNLKEELKSSKSQLFCHKAVSLMFWLVQDWKKKLFTKKQWLMIVRYLFLTQRSLL